MSFRITGLPAEAFQHLFALSDEELAAHNPVRRIADDRSPGYPCRVSLTDSKPGDELILVNPGTTLKSSAAQRFRQVSEGLPPSLRGRRHACS
jgi:hypothetical protein